MKNRPLITQFRLTFIWIIVASIVATIITYGLTFLLYIMVGFQHVYPANYYEQQIPEIEAYIQEEGVSLLAPETESELQRKISGEAITYQVLDGEGTWLYGTNDQQYFTGKEELLHSVNTTFKKGNLYMDTTPIIDETGTIAGAVVLAYPLQMTFAEGREWLGIVNIVVLFSPFLYIIGFTILFSKLFVKNIHNPLKVLMEACQKIKAKDLDFDIPYQSKNELGQLRDAFSDMKEELRRSLATQWKMEQERVEMVEALAHDLKAPLSIIKGYSEALIRSSSTKENVKLEKYLHIIHDNSEKSTALVQQMQDMTDLEQANVSVNLVSVHLQTWLEEKMHYYELQAKQKTIKIDTQIDEALYATYMIDAEKLERILDNIVSNSIRHTPVNGKIVISARLQQEKLFYQICDSGSGFSKKDLDKALDRFYRGDEARSSKEGHAGLGLYIVKQLVEQLDGTIQLSNAKDGGACVTFYHQVISRNKV
ncbi:HAMP domain-containing histidine kinase [Gracilibacillus alcaliphilus]